MGGTTRYPLDRTPDEAALGFALEALPAGNEALVARIASGLVVIKVSEAGQISYEICRDYVPIYAPARTLEELRKRFGLR